MQDIGATAGGIQRAPHKIDQKMIAGGAFDRTIDFLIEDIFGKEPQCAAYRGCNQIDLADARDAVLVTGIAAVVVPGAASDVYGSVLFYRHFAERPDVPLGAVGRVPPERLEAAPPVGFRIGKFQVAPLRIILDLDVFGQRALNGMAHVAVEEWIAVVPARVNPGGKRSLVVAPVVVEWDPVFHRDPVIVIFHYVRLLDGEEGEGFEEGASPVEILVAKLPR